MTFDVFVEKVWDNIREIYRRPREEEEAKDTSEADTDAEPPEAPDVSDSLCELN